MADVNANIGVNIDTSDALNQLKNLQRQISQFHQSVAKSSSAAALAQRDLQKNFINGVNAIQGFSAELRTVRTSAETFTNSLEKNKFSIQQYFRYAASQSKIFGKNFSSEFATIEKTAIERVKTLQTQYVKMGRDAQGAMQAIAIRPTVLNMKDLGTQTAITAQKQVLFNQLIKQGSTNLLNFGKNTQWAGRQLMVGFTLPLATLGMTAGRVFMQMETAAIKFKKVYGDLFTAPEETEKAMEAITELGLAYTKYGVAVSDSLNMAAEAAAAGFQGVDLQNQTTAALNLSVLGQMEMQKALETTIALQNAFRISSQDLVGEIDFLNAVENQTVVSLDDITEATPRVATVIQALGGDVRDLAFFLAAMKEGGVNAAQGANALKSGLASLINPTERASEMLMNMGINIRAIIGQNQGDLRGTVVEFAKALDTLDPLRRAQAIEQLFGKFQFARISALFDNVIRDGSQASRVLDLAGASLGELAELSEKELGVSAASAMNKFRASIEQVKVALAPIGELFLEIATPFIDFATGVLKAFNNLPDGIKKIIGTVITVVGGIGPVLLMTFGLINNGIANMIKFFATVRLGYLKMTGQAKGIGDETQYMTQEQLEAAAAAASLDQAHAGLTQRFTAEKAAVDALRVAYQQAADAGARFATLNPGMMRPANTVQKFAKGGFVSGSGSGDTVPAMLTPGEFVVKKKEAQMFLPLLQAINEGKVPGFANGGIVGGGTTQSQTQFAHVTNKITITIDELLSALTQGTGKISQAMMFTVKDLRDTFGPDLKAHIYSGLGFSQDARLNDAMKEGGAVPATDFLADFESRGADKWAKSIKLGGAKMEDVAAELTVYDAEITKGVTALVSQNKNATITSEQFAILEKEVRQSIPATSRLRTALDAAEKGLFQFRVNPTAQDAQAAGLQPYQVPSSVDPTRMSSKARVTTSQGREIRLGGNKFERVQPLAGVQLSEFNDGLQESAETNSESKRTRLIAKDTVDGYVNELKRGKPEVEQAAEQIVDTIVKKIRRISTDPQTQADIDRINQQKTQATTDSANIASGKFRGYRSASAPQGPAVPVDQALVAQKAQEAQEAITKASQAQLQNLQKMSMNVSAVSFGLSSLTGILSAFGVDLGGIMPVISGVTGALFALSAATSALTQATFARTISERIASAGGGVGGIGRLFTELKGGSTGLKGIGSIIGRVAGAFKTMFPILSRLIVPLGIATTLFSGWQILNDIQEEARRKLRGLSDAANMSAEKIQELGKAAGAENVLQKASFRTEDTTGTAPVSGTDRAEAEDFIENMGGAEEFENKYKDEIAAIENAVGDQERLLAIYQSMAIQFNALGMSEGAIEKVINALKLAAGEKDVVLDFKSLTIVGEDGTIDTAAIETRARNSVAAFEAAAKAERERIQREEAENAKYQDPSGIAPGEGAQDIIPWVEDIEALELVDTSASDTVLAETIAATVGELESLRAAFEAGQISITDYKNATAASIGPLALMGDESENLTDLLIAMEIDPTFVGSLDDIADKTAVLDAALAGVDLTPFQEGLKSNNEETKTQALEDLAVATIAATEATEKYNIETAYDNAVRPLLDEIQALEDQISVKQEVIDISGDAALAQQIAADASLRAMFIAAKAADALAVAAGGTATLVAQLFEDVQKINSLKLEIGGPGGGGKSPFQEAIDSLKEQRQGIKDSISAYAGLRSAGLGVAEASEIAKDSMLSAALASQKVGSAKWNQLVTAIREARAEEEAWLQSTPEGRAEHFAEVYGKVMDVFNAQEDILEMNNEAATAANRKIIESLEKQIDAYERRASELQRDLDKIAEKENEINKAYDEKTKALEKVKKLNQDITNQQKSQLSIAEALSRGDISAAASAMEDASAQFASSQGDATQRGLDAQRDAQLNSLTENGKTRLQIEDEIKQIKNDISVIEFGALQNARDAVAAADEALETAKENLTVQGQTRTEWENINTRIDASKANAALYEAEVGKALLNAQGLVGEWSKLNDTFTTTHVVNTVYNGTPVAPIPATTTTTYGRGYDTPAPAITPPQPEGRKAGGYISGPGTATSDSIPAMLSDGEYVIKAASVDKFGTGFLDSVNKGQLPGFKIGGMVSDGGGGRRNKPTPTLAFKPFTPPASSRVIDTGLFGSPWLYGPQAASTPTTQKTSAKAATQRTAQAQQEAAAQRQRDALYRQGGAQGFEAGFGSTMAAFGKSDAGRLLGEAYSGTGIGNMVFRGLLAMLSIPGEFMGSIAKNLVDFAAKPNLQSLIKLNPLSAINEATGNAFSGVIDPSQQKASLFEQAGQTVIDNKMFGTDTPEGAALARVIAGSLNIFGDPTTYVGVGAVRAGIKAGVRAGSRSAAKIDLAPVAPKPIASTQLPVESFTPDAARELISKSDSMIKQSEFIVTARQAMDQYPQGADWYTALSKDPNYASYVAENGQWIANIPAMIGSKTVPELIAQSQALRVRVGQAKDYINSPAAKAADIKAQMDADFAERTKDMFVAGPDGIEPKTWFPWQRPKTPDQQLLSVFRNRIRPGQLALPPGTGKPNSRTLFRPGNDPHKPLSELWDRRMMAELVEYVFRPKTVHNFTMHQTRQSVDKAFTMDGGYKIPKGSQIARIASGSDSEALAAMKPGQSVVLDRFLSVTDATAPLELRAYKFLKGMAEGSVKTGGTDRAPGKLGAYIKFNVKTDVPGIMDINKILPNVNKFLGRPFEKPSNVVDGLLARGQSMKLRKVRRDKKTGQIIYHVDLGQGIKATKGFISGTRNFEKEMPKFYAKGGLVKGGGRVRKSSTRSNLAKPTLTISADSAERRALAAKKPSQAQAEAAAQAQRDALYKQGGFQGFEAGLGSMMAAFGKSAPGKFLADSYSGTGLGNMAFRGALAILSTPGEIVGSLAKNAMDFIAKPNLQSMIKLNPLAAINEGTQNAFSGVADASNTRASMFEQAAQSVIDNQMFGAGNAENDALARIIGGSLNIFGDPTTYLGVGAVKAGIKAGVRAGSKQGITVSSALASPKILEGIKGILPAPKGTGVNKIDGRPLSNPNLSLAKSTLLRKNFHGDRTPITSKPQSFQVDPDRTNRLNWFGADFFTTTSNKLAKSYGRNNIFTTKMPITQALKMKILDLYPGAPPVGVQFPELVDKLPGLSRGDKLTADARLLPHQVPALKAYLNNPARHVQIALPGKNISEILYNHGIGAIRHQSGHYAGKLNPKFGEVFAFIKPQNMKANPTIDFSGDKFREMMIRKRSDPFGSGSMRPETIRERFELFKSNRFDLKKYNPFTNRFNPSRETWMNTLANGGLVKRYAKGGLATNKFAMGGLVSPKYFAMGGLVSPKYFANGGMAQGTDTVPAMLTPGEFVVNKKSTDMYGPLLAAINSSPASNLSMMGAKTFSEPVYSMPSREYVGLGENVGVYSKSDNLPSQTTLDNSVYNNNSYSVNVNVDGTNASANDIANVVMNKIKTIGSQQVRRQVLR
jgi:TP901 family phage tail tape measure protein